MKIALVHDYLKEFGGAERVLKTLSEMYPEAPIYTAFRVRGSTADQEFKGRKITESWLAPLLKVWRLYSPLRFLAPVIWGSFDLSAYDLVITSCSWYITRGFKIGPKTKVIAYCHTPPRWLYGYETASKFSHLWPVKIYAALVGHFLRMYDFQTAQKINLWIANSQNVRARIKKFYRKNAVVIYPPVDVENIKLQTSNISGAKEDYYFLASRQVGAKGIEEAIKIFAKLGKKLYIAGEGGEFTAESKNIKFLGRLSDEELYQTYAKAKAFIALARDEDFGMTAVEAQAAGTPVIAFKGGGFKESVIDNVTGILIKSLDEKTLYKAIQKIERTKWNKEALRTNARRFSKRRFEEKILQLIKTHAQDKK